MTLTKLALSPAVYPGHRLHGGGWGLENGKIGGRNFLCDFLLITYIVANIDYQFFLVGFGDSKANKKGSRIQVSEVKKNRVGRLKNIWILDFLFYNYTEVEIEDRVLEVSLSNHGAHDID